VRRHPPLYVERIALREIRIPLRRPFEISSGCTDARRILLLELVHPDGPRAWSECVAGELPDYSPETIDTAWLAIRAWLAPRLLDRELAGPEEGFDLLSRDVQGHRMAIAALEMGLWALSATIRGEPLSSLLGGRRVPIPSGITLGLAEPVSDLPARAREALDTGYRRIKLKIAPGRDTDRLRAVREELGPDAPLSADANGAYDRDRMDRLPPVGELGLVALEQPFDDLDWLGHRRLQERIATPVCLDESVVTARQARDLTALRVGRIVNLKPGRVGGFTPARSIHEICRDAGVSLWCGGMLESGVGRAYNAALASLPGFELPGDIYPPGTYLVGDIVEDDWTLSDDGTVTLPGDGDGIGVRVDRDRIEDLTVHEESLTASPTGPDPG